VRAGHGYERHPLSLQALEPLRPVVSIMHLALLKLAIGRKAHLIFLNSGGQSEIFRVRARHRYERDIPSLLVLRHLCQVVSIAHLALLKLALGSKAHLIFLNSGGKSEIFRVRARHRYERDIPSLLVLRHLCQVVSIAHLALLNLAMGRKAHHTLSHPHSKPSLPDTCGVYERSICSLVCRHSVSMAHDFQ
jgi:hypothetical protein